MITGFHGLHVTAGVIYLLSIYRVISRVQDMQYNYMVTEIAGLYWHFVDLVWIMVFTFVYLL
jgi:cytochrome c oxidase subunit 3